MNKSKRSRLSHSPSAVIAGDYHMPGESEIFSGRRPLVWGAFLQESSRAGAHPAQENASCGVLAREDRMLRCRRSFLSGQEPLLRFHLLVAQRDDRIGAASAGEQGKGRGDTSSPRPRPTPAALTDGRYLRPNWNVNELPEAVRDKPARPRSPRGNQGEHMAAGATLRRRPSGAELLSWKRPRIFRVYFFTLKKAVIVEPSLAVMTAR